VLFRSEVIFQLELTVCGGVSEFIGAVLLFDKVMQMSSDVMM